MPSFEKNESSRYEFRCGTCAGLIGFSLDELESMRDAVNFRYECECGLKGMLGSELVIAAIENAKLDDEWKKGMETRMRENWLESQARRVKK
mgnify:CR=1 FL=1